MLFADIAAGYPTDMPGILGIWAALILMLMIYTYPLYKENIAYRFAEYTYVAVAMAIGIIVTLDSLIRTQLTPLVTGGRFLLVIPIILGFMMYCLLIPDYRWVSRYPIAILVGSSMGVGISSQIIPNILNQIISTIQHPGAGATATDWFSFVFIAVGTICATLYFLLTYEHKGPVTYATQAGRYFIMLGLGAYFGNTVLFRLSMLATRAQLLLQVLKIIPM
jgi:hypothetical protein